MVLIGLFAAALLQTGLQAGSRTFDRYPAPVTRPVNRMARHATPRLTDPLSRRYRSTLREAAARRPDFAGHWVLAQAGCGAGCLRPAAVDRITGRVVWFPATISGWPLAVQEPLDYRRTSRLLVVQGMLNEAKPSATRRYLFDGRRFVRLGT